MKSNTMVRKGALALAGFMIVLGSLAFAQEEDATQYKVELQIFETNVAPRDSLTLNSNSVTANSDDKISEMSWIASGNGLAVGPIKIIFDGPDLRIEPDGWQEKGVMSLVAKPSLATVEGQEASIRIGQDGVEFLERREDGLFELKKSETLIGFSAAFTVNPKENDTSRVIANFQFKLTQLTGRVPIEGVSLPVGVPITSRRQLSTTYILELGKWTGCVYPMANDPGLLAAIRITRVGEADTSAKASPPRHKIESKVYRFPESAQELLRLRTSSPVTASGHETGGLTLSAPVWGEFPGQTSTRIRIDMSPTIDYRVDDWANAIIFDPEDEGAELVSAPRVTIKPKSSGEMFKIMINSRSPNNEGEFGGRGSGGGGRGDGDSPSSSESLTEKLKSYGLSPDIMALIADNLGSSAVIFDIKSNDRKIYNEGIALAFAVAPDAERGAVQLDVVLHYRLPDHTMERKGLFGRLKPVHAGIADLQTKQTESLMADEALVIYQRMPHSGDLLLTFITVEEVR